MRYSTQIKPISYVKANAAEIIDQLAEGGSPMIITRNGEAKAVLQDIRSYEEEQEALALLKILALGQRDIDAGRLIPLQEVVDELKSRPDE